MTAGPLDLVIKNVRLVRPGQPIPLIGRQFADATRDPGNNVSFAVGHRLPK